MERIRRIVFLGQYFVWRSRDYGRKGEEVDEDGKNYAWVELTVRKSDERGEAVFEDLIAGQYRLTEIQAPKGYQLLMSPVEFSISGKEETLDKTIYIENRPRSTSAVNRRNRKRTLLCIWCRCYADSSENEKKEKTTMRIGKIIWIGILNPVYRDADDLR